jgi:thiol-disulfide isomerase/thioredoxin
MAGRQTLFPALKWVALAVLAGVTAGFAAVYVSGAGSGNAPALSAADAACTGKAARAKALGAAAVGGVAAMLPADPPVSFRDLAFEDGAGKPITLADLEGKAVLLNLWATWCAPCRAEMPALDRLEREEGSEDFEVVAVNLDTGGAEKPRRFLAETGVTALAPYRDASLGVFNALKERGLVLGLPATFLVDAQGCMLAGMNGPAAWDGPDAKKLVRAAAEAS